MSLEEEEDCTREQVFKAKAREQVFKEERKSKGQRTQKDNRKTARERNVV